MLKKIERKKITLAYELIRVNVIFFLLSVYIRKLYVYVYVCMYVSVYICMNMYMTRNQEELKKK